MPMASQIDLPERYRVARHIASGGMASVWEVEDQLLGRIVAVKVLSPQFAADPGARERFQREARTAAQVSAHPHVVTIYDIGEHGDDAFIVMEYFPGGTVADRLRAARDGGEQVARETALRWLREAAAGLDVAHGAGIVHRDVKPANLLLDAQDRVAVADFGIARLADDTQMTQTGQVLGTAAYLSPEQSAGQPATAASDRYALAVVAFELLCGRRPFEGGPAAAQLRQHAEEPPPRASEIAAGVPSAVDAVLIGGLAKDPAQRPATASELVDALERALDDAPTDSTRRMAAAPLPVAAPRSEPDPEPEPQPAARPEPEPTPAAHRPATAERAAAASPPPVARRRPQPAAPRPAAPAGEPARQAARKPPVAAVIAIAALLVGGLVGLAVLGGNDGPGQRASEPPSGTQASAPRERTQTSSAAPAEPQPQGDAPEQPVAAGSQDPAALNDRGFQLIQAGDYAAAVEPLQAAVQGYRDRGQTGGLPYNYALYNLGVALNRSGNPEAAIPYLEERLKHPNQRGVVQQELADAQAKLDGAGKPAKKDKDEEKEDDGDG
jgi:eukaryotic-like serine/threonine-protein kinase